MIDQNKQMLELVKNITKETVIDKWYIYFIKGLRESLSRLKNNIYIFC
jgi:hypothetical protein